MLIAWHSLQCGDQLAQAWSQDDEIARWTSSLIIGVRHSGWDEDSCSSRGLDSAINKAEREGSLQDMPCLVIGMVDM